MTDLSFSPDNDKRKRRYTEMQQYILDNVVTKHGGDAIEAALAAGYRRPAEAVASLKDELKEITEQILVQTSVKAALTLKEVLHSDGVIPNIKEKISVSKEVLEHTNPKTTKVDTGDAKLGIFILPPKGAKTDE